MRLLKNVLIAEVLVGLCFAPVAEAQPDLEPLINTTCSYDQINAALRARYPLAADKLNTTPMAQGILREFLSETPQQRRDLIAQFSDSKLLNDYAGDANVVAAVCMSY